MSSDLEKMGFFKTFFFYNFYKFFIQLKYIRHLRFQLGCLIYYKSRSCY